jgi:transposase
MARLKRFNVDIEEMRELWGDGWSVEDLAKRFGCSSATVYNFSNLYAWPARGGSNEPPPPSDEDERLSCDSLALSPWVEARVAQFREAKQRQREQERAEVMQVRMWRREYGVRAV